MCCCPAALLLHSPLWHPLYRTARYGTHQQPQPSQASAALHHVHGQRLRSRVVPGGRQLLAFLKGRCPSSGCRQDCGRAHGSAPEQLLLLLEGGRRLAVLQLLLAQGQGGRPHARLGAHRLPGRGLHLCASCCQPWATCAGPAPCSSRKADPAKIWPSGYELVPRSSIHSSGAAQSLGYCQHRGRRCARGGCTAQAHSWSMLWQPPRWGYLERLSSKFLQSGRLLAGKGGWAGLSGGCQPEDGTELLVEVWGLRCLSLQLLANLPGAGDGATL